MKFKDLKDKIHTDKIKENISVDKIKDNIPVDKIKEVMKNAESKAKEELEKRYNQAKEILDDDEKVDDFLEKTEKKLKTVPKLGDKLSMIPMLIMLVKDYVKKYYTEFPSGTMLAIVASLIYFLSPADLVSDVIPILGLTDDAAILGKCLDFAKDDLKKYNKWKYGKGQIEQKS